MSGVGRGRGWLNINKNVPTKPGLPSPVETVLHEYHEYQANIVAPISPNMNPKHKNIISKIEMFSENDDGILMNQKIKHIIEVYEKECASAKDVEDAFTSIYDHCLADADFAARAISMASRASFNQVRVHGLKIRNLFIGKFQANFEGCKELRATNPKGFRNAVKMLGDFYHKARLADGSPFKFLSSPMVKYLDMLLESNSEIDLEIFTIQLYMNGTSIKDELPSKLNEILIQVRTKLATSDRLSSIGKLWLMLSLDISNNRFMILPKEVNQFYVSQLGDEAMSRIKRNSHELSIQTTYHDLSLDSIHSNVNVLQQVSNSATTTTDGWESPPSDTENLSLANEVPQAPPQHTTKYPTKPRSNYTKNPKDAGFNYIGTWEQPKNEKTPRPILGAGVRLKHTDKNLEDTNNWKKSEILGAGVQLKHTEKNLEDTNNWKKSENDWKDNSSGWGDNKKNKGSGSCWISGVNKPRTKSTGKGWEHDDRFENEYN